MEIATDIKALTPGKVFEEKNVSILQKIASNQYVASMVMGILARLFVIAVQMGKPFEGVYLSPPESHVKGEWRARLKFNSLAAPVVGLWQFGGDLANYVSGKSQRMAEALKKNPGVEKWLTELVKQIDQFCVEKNIQFRHVITHAFINKDGVMVVKIKNREVFDRWGR